jgi:hypothetical protein
MIFLFLSNKTGPATEYIIQALLLPRLGRTKALKITLNLPQWSEIQPNRRVPIDAPT